nr:hypothetical protein [Tanacetum cinerariifolium]
MLSSPTLHGGDVGLYSYGFFHGPGSRLLGLSPDTRDRSKAFRVFNSRTRIVHETLHINFLENQPNVAGSGPTWLFDIDTLTQSMNYQAVVAGNQPNSSAGIQENFTAGIGGKEAESVQQYVLLPLCSDKIKKHNEKTKREAKGKSHVELSTGVRDMSDEFEEFSDNSTNGVNAASTPVTAVRPNLTNSTNTFSTASPSNTAISPTFDIDDEEDVGAEADFSNLETNITVRLIPTTRVHKDHPVTQIIGDLSSASQTRSMARMVKEQDLPKGKRAIGSKWVFRNKKDERGIVIRNKARLVAHGHTQEEGIDYEEVFAPVARIEAIWLFLAYASFMGFMVYQMDAKSAFLYGTIEEEVYVCQPPGFENPDYPAKVYKVVKALYGLHQAPRAWYETLANYLLENDLCKDFEKLMKDKFQMRSIVKRIFRYLKGKPHLGLWYPKGSPFNLVAYSDSDYAGASLDKKSTTGGCQFLGHKQFWTSVSIKKSNDVVRLQALIDRKKVIITEDSIRQALRLDDADSVDCLPNEEIFAELARIGYEKPSTKLTFYKTFFSAQWNLVRNVDNPSKFLMYLRFLQLMINAQIGDLSSHTTKYTSPTIRQKVFANMRRIGKGFSRVDTPLFDGMLVPQQAQDVEDTAEDEDANHE